MSGMLFLLMPLILILVWCGLTALLWRAWRHKRTEAAEAPWRVDVTFAVLAAVWLSIGFWYGGGRKIYYDMEVNRLCAVDGGVKIYETVKLPASKFDKHGNAHIPLKKNASPNDEYFYEWETRTLSAGDSGENGKLMLRREDFKFFRAKDNVLLGEDISYVRRGGDMPGPSHPSVFRCPNAIQNSSIEKLIFLKGEEK